MDNRYADYLLGSSDAEHERLIRQARRLAPVTERFLREAGISLGQRILDIGRFILQFLPDPVGALRSLSEKVRPGGIIAFQEGSWAPFALLSAHLPLWPDFTRWVSDVVSSVRPQIEKLNLPLEKLGDLDTLQQRLQEEVASSNTVVPWLALVGAWCRKPVN